MLNSIRLIDFKNYADTTIRLGELALLVGPNGAGKTSVLQGIHLVSQALQGDAESTLAKLGSSEVFARIDDRPLVDERVNLNEFNDFFHLSGWPTRRKCPEQWCICAWTRPGCRNPATWEPRTPESISTGMGWRPASPT